MITTRRVRLRGATLVAAPFFVLGLIGAALAVATLLWGQWEGHRTGAAYWATLVGSVAVGLAGFAAARGCFVEVRGDVVRDVVAWITVHRVDRRRILTARVAAGVWRWFVVELDDGTRRTLLGACPAQFPARLVPGSRADDEADLDALLGDG